LDYKEVERIMIAPNKSRLLGALKKPIHFSRKWRGEEEEFDKAALT